MHILSFGLHTTPYLRSKYTTFLNINSKHATREILNVGAGSHRIILAKNLLKINPFLKSFTFA